MKSSFHPDSAKLLGFIESRINACTVLPRAWRVALSAAFGNWGFCCVAPASLHTLKSYYFRSALDGSPRI